MNILLSAYSVNPYKGSEDAVGWNWTVTLSRKFPSSTIYLLTKTYNEKATRKGIEEYGLKNVKLIIKEVPRCLDWFREKHSAFHHMYYILWQKYAYHWAKNCGVHFDIIHHVTMGNYRITGDMYKFKDAYTIFGPVAGAQKTPEALKCYYGSIKKTENFREAIDKFMLKYPPLKNHLGKFDAIYAVNNETKEVLEKISERKINKLSEIAILNELQNLNIEKNENDVTEIIYLGRFVEWKGLMFLIDAISKISTDKKYHVSLYGSGELTAQMQKKIDEYNLQNIVTIKGYVKHSQIRGIYTTADIFAHPSLRESGGAVFVEAMAHKLPIVALNQSLSSDLNENKCGLFVDVNGSREQIINDFAAALTELIENRELRLELGQNGYDYANRELTMDNKFNIVYSDILKETD